MTGPIANLPLQASEDLALPERRSLLESDRVSFFLPGRVTSEDTPDPREWLAAIIEGSDDAIISKDLNGVIQSWNNGATRLFGYSADEVIGKSITILIPQDRLDEEPLIIAQIQKGNRVEHFETKRRRKDGTAVDISLTISPIRNPSGTIVGASKIARDISERVAAQEQQKLLMGEMRHRVKNLFALATAIVSISSRSTSEPVDVIRMIHARLTALSRAHELTMSDLLLEPESAHRKGLLSIIETILEPYASDGRIDVRGDDLEIGSKALTNIALLLHEFATNAAKYGALSLEGGRLFVEVRAELETVRLTWRETGSPATAPGEATGFGSRLEQGLTHALGATIEREWTDVGLNILVLLPATTLGV